MKRSVSIGLLLPAMLACLVAELRADVKAEEKNQVKFEGMLGRMMGLFGGKAAKEGTVSTVAVKGNRKMAANELTGEIIDLDERKIYNLDMRKKSYEVVTFEEMRRRMEEAQEKAAKASREETKKEAEPAQNNMEIDVSLKDSGQKRNINGYDCHEVVMTVTARQKGKTLEEGGGYVMTSRMWLGPEIPAMKEVAEFDQRYAKALGISFGMAGAEQMAMATAMYPAMKDMMGKMEVENVKTEGTPILTETTMEAVKNPEQMAQENKQQEESGSVTSIRGIGGILGRRMARKKEEESAAKNRATIFTMNHELLKASTNVSATDISIPAGFKEKKK